MGGSSKKQTVGYWYKLLYHAGLSKGPIDAFLEFRGGDKTAWKGELTASATISIDKPKLWGGEKDQGGIVSDVDVMFGEAGQAANAYLLANLGSQVPAWRGLATLVFKGGRYGAMNPYPQKASYKIRKILQGWDGAAWYPAKARVGMADIANQGILPGAQCVLSWDQSSFHVSNNDHARMGIEFIDGSGALISSVLADMIGTQNHVWTPRSIAAPIPAGTKYVNLVMAMQRFEGANNDGYIRAIDLSIDGVSVPVVNPSADDGTAFGWIGRQGGLGIYGNVDGPGYMFMGGVSPYTEAYQPWPPAPGAMNPAHVLYYARSNADMGREPTANINAASLTAAADTLFAEGFGICTSYDPAQESVEEFEGRITKLIDGSFSRDPITGQWYLDLARGDYVLDDLPILTDDDILEFREQPSTLDNAINSVSITYFDPERKETITTPPVQARALIQDFGTIHQTIEYPEIPTATLAARVAERELRATATPTRAFELVCTRKPYAWRPNTYFRLQVPKRGIADMVCIVGEKGSGSLKSGAIRLKAAQDIYSMPVSTFVEIEPGVDTSPSPVPVPITQQAAFEAPYIELVANLSRADLDVLPDDAAYLLAVAADPAASRDYTMMVDAGAGYLETANGDWCPTATVVEASDWLDTAFTLAGGTRLDEVVVGSAALWESEIVRVDAIDPGTGAITLARGCADTLPAQHAAGSRIWFWQDNAAVDLTEYSDGEALNVKLLTNTASQQIDIALATAIAVGMGGRAVLPYPPANIQINGSHYPASIGTADLVTLTWAHRDRILQADQLIDWTQGDIGPEPGVTYTIWLYGETDELERTVTGLTGTSYTWETEVDDSLILDNAAGDPYWSYVKALARFEGADGSTTYTDETGRTISYIGGNIVTAEHPAWATSSVYSTYQYGIANYAPSADWDISVGDFTIEAWIKVPSGTTSYHGIVSRRSSGAKGWHWYWSDSGGGNLHLAGLLGTYHEIVVSSPGDCPMDVWHYVGLRRVANTYEIWIDGALAASATEAGTLNNESAIPLNLGRSNNTTEGPWNGWLSNFRFTKGLARDLSVVPTGPFPGPAYRLNDQVRVEIASVRGAYASLHYSHTVQRLPPPSGA